MFVTFNNEYQSTVKVVNTNLHSEECWLLVYFLRQMGDSVGTDGPGPMIIAYTTVHTLLMEFNFTCSGMLKQGGGQIVNTSSIAGKAGYVLRTYYCASKHALIGLMDSLRFEVSLDTNSVFGLQPFFKHALECLS